MHTETEENYDESRNSRCPSKDLDLEPPNTSKKHHCNYCRAVIPFLHCDFLQEFTRSESILDHYWPLGPSAKSTTKEEGKKKERRRKTLSCGICTLRD